MAYTRVSCCLVCSCISWDTPCLISHVSFMVAVPVSHFNASPKKGNRLLLDHGFSGSDRFWNSDSVLSNCTAHHMVDSPRRTLNTKCDASVWPWSFTSSW